MSASLRYTILLHEGLDAAHYDLLFELSPGSALAAWRCPDWPPHADSPLTPLPDHRPVYLTYEGPVSGDRGQVRRIATGVYQVLSSEVAVFTVLLDTNLTLRLPRR